MTVGLRSWSAGRSARQKLDDRAAKADHRPGYEPLLRNSIKDLAGLAADEIEAESGRTPAESSDD